MANIATAFANTLMGMGTVFVMLIFISLLISLFVYIPKLEEKIKNIGKKPEPVKTEEPAAVVEEPQTQADSLQEDKQLVAVITAAIMASYGSNAVSADKLVVRSIHRVDGISAEAMDAVHSSYSASSTLLPVISLKS